MSTLALPLVSDPVTGLDAETFAVDDTFPAGDLVTPPGGRGSFYRGRNGQIVTHFRPVQPKAVEPLAAQNAHGALITELTSTDVGIDPLFARPTLDSGAIEPEVPFDDAGFPAKLQTVTTVDSLAGRTHKLVLSQGQFFANDPDDAEEGGTQRLFTHIAGGVLISSSSDYRQPAFDQVEAIVAGGAAQFEVTVGDPGDGPTNVRRVLVAFLAAGGGGPWTFVDLVRSASDPSRWSGTASTAATGVQFFVQAVDAAGNVGVTSNKAFLYAGAPAPANPGDLVPLLNGAPAGGAPYGGAVQITVEPPAGVTVRASIDGGELVDLPRTVSGDGIHNVYLQGSDGSFGEATFVIRSDSTPPVITISAPAGGAAYWRGSSLTANYTCSDNGGSGVAFCIGPVASGALVSTATTGPKTFKVDAADNAGNASVKVVSYTVVEACVGSPPAGAIVRGSGNDTINGTSGNDVIVDSGGNNKIDGKGGNDIICSGSGNDTLVGGDGDDIVIDTGGNNTVDGGNGNDQISTRNGNDKVTTGAGNDIVKDTGGNNVVDTGLGDDGVTTGSGNDAISTGDGKDVVVDSGGNNKVTTGRGDDQVTTGSANDTISLGEGNDVLVDAGGNNNVDVGAGVDLVTTGSGNDTIAGGAQDDTINAGNGNNVVNAGEGDDQITAGTGNDRIDGGPGHDVCKPGSGNNTVTNCEA